MNSGVNRGIFTNLLFVIILLAVFFLLSRSSNKKKMQEEEIRKNLKIGDEVVTVGGIIGKIVSFREENDSAVIETSGEKIRVKRWAISLSKK